MNNSNSKISFLIPNFTIGGAEMVMVSLANYFVKTYKVDVIVLKRKGNLIKKLDSNITIHDLNIRNMKLEFFGLFKLIKHLRKNHTDNLIVFMWPLNVIAVLSKIFLVKKLNIILTDHTTYSKTRWIKNPMKKCFFILSVFLTYPFANHRVAVSKGVNDDLVKLCYLKSRSIKTIYNPVNQVYPSIRKINDAKEQNKKKTLLMVSTLKKVKNHILMIETLKELLSIDPYWKLNIIGDGPEKENIQRKICELGLEENVFLKGAKIGKDLSEEYFNADFYILVSRYEGFGLCLVEAMAHGLPLIAVDIESGPREIIASEQIGLLIANHDKKNIIKAILKAKTLVFSKEFLVHQTNSYKIENIGKKYEDLII